MTLALVTPFLHNASSLTIIGLTLGFVALGMALNLQDMVLAKRRFFHAAAVDANAYGMAIAFFSWLSQQGSNPNLEVVEFSALSDTDVVIANVPCKLYAILAKKATATATFTKGTDNATTCSTDGSQDLSLKMADIFVHQLYWCRGRACANGWTMQGNTTGTGSTGSAANGAAGVVLLGAA